MNKVKSATPLRGPEVKSDLEQRAQELESQLKRALADYQNLEKRINEGRSELTSFVGAELVRKLLPVLDHLEKSLEGVSDQERQSGWFRGVELAVREFQSVLQSEGLDEIPADGVFDPVLHEAVDTREGEENSILEVTRKGYNLNGKVLRPAQVVVGSKMVEKETEQQLEKTVDTGDYA